MKKNNNTKLLIWVLSLTIIISMSSVSSATSEGRNDEGIGVEFEISSHEENDPIEEDSDVSSISAEDETNTISKHGKASASGTQSLLDAKSVSCGDYHTGAVMQNGSLWLWGSNDWGRLGDGTGMDNSKSMPVKIMDRVTAVSLGGWHSAAVKEDGTLWLWGCNNGSLLGDGTEESKSTPVKIMDSVKAVSLGGNHSAAIKKDGTLWTWGRNDGGQLGDGTEENKSAPIKIMDNVKAVSLGGDHSAAITEDGSLWLWGRNGSGRIGDGTQKSILTPTKIMDNVKAVSLGGSHSAAIKEDGSLWMWGRNNEGKLGDGTRVDKITPVKIMDNVKAVSLGEDHSAAIKEDGTLWTWGRNDRGQLGDGTKEYKSAPIKIMDNVKAVSLGYSHSAAIKEDGSLWMWGFNLIGQLGNGLHESSAVPSSISIPPIKHALTDCEYKKYHAVYYTGRKQQPRMEISYFGHELYRWKDYNLSYSNNKNVGYMTVRATGVDGFQGSFKVKVPIKPDQIKITKLKTSRLRDGKTQIILKPKAKYKKPTRYDITIATDLNFNSRVASIEYKKSKLRHGKMGLFGKLKKGKTYYLRVRAVKKVKLGTLYGKWSKVKKIKGR